MSESSNLFPFYSTHSFPPSTFTATCDIFVVTSARITFAPPYIIADRAAICFDTAQVGIPHAYGAEAARYDGLANAYKDLQHAAEEARMIHDGIIDGKEVWSRGKRFMRGGNDEGMPCYVAWQRDGKEAVEIVVRKVRLRW